MWIRTGYREPTPAENVVRAIRWAYGPEYIKGWYPESEPKPGDLVAEYRHVEPPETNDAVFRSRYQEECAKMARARGWDTL